MKFFIEKGEIAKIESGNYETLAQTDYILIEFSYEIRYREMYNALNNILQIRSYAGNCSHRKI